jgi:hypothetical protein
MFRGKGKTLVSKNGKGKKEKNLLIGIDALPDK